MPFSKRATVCRNTKNNIPIYRSLQNIAFTYIIVDSESMIWLFQYNFRSSYNVLHCRTFIKTTNVTIVDQNSSVKIYYENIQEHS